VQAKFAIAGGHNSSRAMESLCCDSGIIRFAENSIVSCEESGSHSGSDSKTNPHLHPLPLGKGEAKSNARSVCKVTSAYGIGKLHTRLTRALSAWLSWGNRIPGALPQAGAECCAFGASQTRCCRGSGHCRMRRFAFLSPRRLCADVVVLQHRRGKA
jgi:hypothetical protein